MTKILRQVLLLGSVQRLFATVPSTSLDMVRFFPNPYDDYMPGRMLGLNRQDVIDQIAEQTKNIMKRVKPTPKSVDGGLYVGITGIAYMFYRLSKNPLLSEHKAQYLEKGLEYIRPGLQTSSGDKTAFLLGDAGTYAVATVLFKETGNEQSAETLKMYKSLYNTFLNPKFLKCGGDELFVGRAGYLAGALWLSRELNTPVLNKESLHKLCDVIVESGREYSKKQKSRCPLMYHYYDTQYLGAAHGISFILQMLMSVPEYLETNMAAAADIRATMDFIADLQNEEGNWPCCMEEVGLKNASDHKLVHWCHGAPGMVYLFAKALLLHQDEKYLNLLKKASDVVWNKGLLRKGPGICHGVAGNGYVFLLMYRLTGDEKYMHRAKAFSDFMNTEDFIRDARVPDNPESLYEGTAGTVCFLSDLLVPDKAEFPFQDVFSSAHI